MDLPPSGVSLHTLISRGLLRPGATLHWARPQSGETHTAFLLADGTLALIDGTRHATPSGAASHVAGRPENGWHAWKTTNGNPISALRYGLAV
ncbi:hypothetical protein [Streptomyces sp. NPDC058193]|uniref:restriction system modified-DNA reader domain-containing protein n=1 Tax=Streptomyces sp. NPDC058193 TaxID=3346373 RepID=UPI0036ED50BF